MEWTHSIASLPTEAGGCFLDLCNDDLIDQHSTRPREDAKRKLNDGLGKWVKCLGCRICMLGPYVQTPS